MRGIDFSKIEDLEKFAKIPKDERDSLVDKDRIEAEKLNIKIDKDVLPNFMKSLKQLQIKYRQNAASHERYYDEIIEKVFYPR